MVPTRAIREKAMQLLAADSTTLAPAALPNKIALIMAAFTPLETLILADLTLATFDGSTPIDCGVGTQPEGLDPANADSIISILPPAGGFRFETTGLTNLPQTIFGFALINNGLTTLFASATLETPIDLTAVNQVINLDDVEIRQLASSMS